MTGANGVGIYGNAQVGIDLDTPSLLGAPSTNSCGFRCGKILEKAHVEVSHLLVHVGMGNRTADDDGGFEEWLS
jgi:hypothetical protein